jgi:hypothetical protein
VGARRTCRRSSGSGSVSNEPPLRAVRPTSEDSFAKDARQWFLDMCDGVGIERPSDEVADRVAADTVNYVKARLNIPVPRALVSLRALRARGVDAAHRVR